MKNHLESLRKKLSANCLAKTKNWNGYEVYKPIYRTSSVTRLPKIILVKNGIARLSTNEECFAYMKFLKAK